MANDTVSVKISTSVVKKVRQLKKKSGINVGRFFEMAALEKIDSDKEITKALPIINTPNVNP